MINKKHEIKLLDHQLLNYGANAYTSKLYTPINEGCLCPLLLESLKKRYDIPIYNQKKSDIFALGISVLCAANGRDFKDYYDLKYLKVKMVYESY